MWQGADVVVGITVSWIPYAADYTRFSRTRRGALAGTGIGYLVPDAWLLALGAVLVLSRDLGDPAALPAAVVAGGFAAIVALFALLVTETDEAFANAYSAAVSLQNAVPRAPQALLVSRSSAIATAGALVLDFTSYQSFLLLLGSVFVPLFAVLLADWLAAGAHYTPEDVFESPAWRPGLLAAWVAGFALYQWLFPTGPGWWVDLVERLDPPTGASARPCRAFSSRSGSRASSRCWLDAARPGRRRHDADRGSSGHLARDVVAGGDPRPGGGVFWSTRALAHLGADAVVTAACSADDRPALLPPLEAFGLRGDVDRVVDDDRVQLPLRRRPADHVAGGRRRLVGARAGRRGRRRGRVGQRLRADAHGLPVGDARRPAADGRRLLVDLQGLVRTATIGPLHTDEHRSATSSATSKC